MAFKRLPGVSFSGLDEFKHELQVLTANLVDEANGILLEHAEAAKADIAAAYPVKKGALRAGLVLRPARGLVLAGAELLQTAPHGWLYEHGSRPRYNKAGAYRGFMRAADLRTDGGSVSAQRDFDDQLPLVSARRDQRHGRRGRGRLRSSHVD